MPERRTGEPLNRFIGEPLNQFIARFVSAKREKRKFPKIKQRLAVGYAEARREARKHG